MQKHTRRVVLSTPIVTVSTCACGHVLVDLGATSIRFDQESFEHVATALGHALNTLERLGIGHRTEKADA